MKLTENADLIYCYLYKSSETMAFFGRAAALETKSTGKDIEVSDPPGDSISAISFSSTADYLAAASWNNEVRICSSLEINRPHIQHRCASTTLINKMDNR